MAACKDSELYEVVCHPACYSLHQPVKKLGDFCTVPKKNGEALYILFLGSLYTCKSNDKTGLCENKTDLTNVTGKPDTVI